MQIHLGHKMADAHPEVDPPGLMDPASITLSNLREFLKAFVKAGPQMPAVQVWLVDCLRHTLPHHDAINHWHCKLSAIMRRHAPHTHQRVAEPGAASPSWLML